MSARCLVGANGEHGVAVTAGDVAERMRKMRLSDSNGSDDDHV